jgi:single-strand DNA-binding protein
MAGVNKVMIVGRLGKDPELRSTQSGKKCGIFSVATSETWTINGNKEEKTEWHRIVVWEKLADLAENYLKKGMLIYLEGKLQTRSWQDQQGQKHFVTEIVANNMTFLESVKKEEPQNITNEPAKQQTYDRPMDDDIPF